MLAEGAAEDAKRVRFLLHCHKYDRNTDTLC